MTNTQYNLVILGLNRVTPPTAVLTMRPGLYVSAMETPRYAAACSWVNQLVHALVGSIYLR